jgi:hypothetical protein
MMATISDLDGNILKVANVHRRVDRRDSNAADSQNCHNSTGIKALWNLSGMPGRS